MQRACSQDPSDRRRHAFSCILWLACIIFVSAGAEFLWEQSFCKLIEWIVYYIFCIIHGSERAERYKCQLIISWIRRMSLYRQIRHYICKLIVMYTDIYTRKLCYSCLAAL